MSKIAEQKALETYPLPKEETESTSFINQETFNSAKRTGYIVGYDQALQDFLEKAEKWLESTFKSIAGYNCGGDLMNNFKNYMQDEIQN